MYVTLFVGTEAAAMLAAEIEELNHGYYPTRTGRVGDNLSPGVYIEPGFVGYRSAGRNLCEVDLAEGTITFDGHRNGVHCSPVLGSLASMVRELEEAGKARVTDYFTTRLDRPWWDYSQQGADDKVCTECGYIWTGGNPPAQCPDAHCPATGGTFWATRYPEGPAGPDMAVEIYNILYEDNNE